MEYIIIFRSNHRDPFVYTDGHDFKETFSSYEEAKTTAERTIDNDWFHDYEIFQTAEK